MSLRFDERSGAEETKTPLPSFNPDFTDENGAVETNKREAEVIVIHQKSHLTLLISFFQETKFNRPQATVKVLTFI